MCVALWDDLKSKISDTIRLAASGRLESLVIQRAVGPIAQSVEQRTFNPWVDGSSPSGPTQTLLLGMEIFSIEKVI